MVKNQESRLMFFFIKFFLLFYIGGCLTNRPKIIDHHEVSGIKKKAIEQLGENQSVLAQFSFFKCYRKALFFAQNLLRKSSAIFTFPQSGTLLAESSQLAVYG